MRFKFHLWKYSNAVICLLFLDNLCLVPGKILSPARCESWAYFGVLQMAPEQEKSLLPPFMHWCCTCYYTPCLYLHFQMKSFRCGAASVQAPMANLASTLSISPRWMRAGPDLWELLPIGQKAWEICKHLSYKPALTASAVIHVPGRCCICALLVSQLRWIISSQGMILVFTLARNCFCCICWLCLWHCTPSFSCPMSRAVHFHGSKPKS